jgi:hypothetical protein
MPLNKNIRGFCIHARKKINPFQMLLKTGKEINWKCYSVRGVILFNSMLNLCNLRPINSMFSIFWSQAKLTLLIDSELFLTVSRTNISLTWSSRSWFFFEWMNKQVMVITAISNYWLQLLYRTFTPYRPVWNECHK